jgi:Bacterial regulatory proteins, luxR family
MAVGGRDMESRSVLWGKLREFLLRLSYCQTKSEFLRTACIEIQTIIPFDTGSGVFDPLDTTVLEGIGLSDSGKESYNTYYRTKQPGFLPTGGKHMVKEWLYSTWVVDWRNFDDLEFAADFMFPNRMYRSLGHFIPGHQLTIGIERSRMGPDFSQADIDNLGLVNEYVNALYSGMGKEGNISDTRISTESVKEGFRCLSHREAEICSLVARRLNTAEIATCLFISPRTVEKHIESIFEKLDVRSREQVRWKLGVTPTAGLWKPKSRSKSQD